MSAKKDKKEAFTVYQAVLDLAKRKELLEEELVDLVKKINNLKIKRNKRDSLLFLLSGGRPEAIKDHLDEYFKDVEKTE